MKTVLVTGGAGYIGSHACKALRAAGHTPVTFDNLDTGWRDAVRYGPFEEGDLQDRARLEAVFARHKPTAVMHFAALSDIAAATCDPGRTWRVNVTGSLNLIETAVAAGCQSFILSSTCAVYGNHTGDTLTEATPRAPLNAYGASKRAIEDMLSDFEVSHALRSVIFRYFNVAGADPEGEIGERHEPETHLIPLALQAIDGMRPALTVNGTDYATPDGTCIRDYVHVCDLARAHVQGLDWLDSGRDSRVFNLGSGRGFSVREVLSAAEQVTGQPVPLTYGPRRAGDCTRLVASPARAHDELGWRPERSDLETMIGDAWAWHQQCRARQDQAPNPARPTAT